MGKPVQLLVLILLSLATVAQGDTELEMEVILTRMIVKENSPLCLSFDFYELDQLFIIQQHVDTVSVEFYQVYVRFTAVVSCKPNGPSSCEDQVRLCNAQFKMNGSDVNDDVCMCDALPDLSFGSDQYDDDTEDTKLSNKETTSPAVSFLEGHKNRPSKSESRNDNIKGAGKENTAPAVRHSLAEPHPGLAHSHQRPALGRDDKNSDMKRELGSLEKGKLHAIGETDTTHKNEDPLLKTKKDQPNQTDNGPTRKLEKAVEKEDHADVESSLETQDGANSDVQELLKSLWNSQEEEAALDNIERRKSETSEGPLNSIDLLMFIQSAVEAVNDASHGNLSLTLSKILSISHKKEPTGANSYYLQVDCTQPGSVPQRCNITCRTQPRLDKGAQLLSYACSKVSHVIPLTKNSKNKAAASSKSHQIQLIAEYAAIQMDEIDADDYRRVVLQVVSVREQITMNGSGVLYSLSMVIVSTSCVETTSLNNKDSQNCLDQVISPEQFCDVNCVRSCTSDEPPELVSSQCGPLPGTPEHLQDNYFK